MKNILFFYYDSKEKKTVLTTRDNKIMISLSNPDALLSEACLHYGTSIKGAKESFIFLTGFKRNIPICLSAPLRLLFFPVPLSNHEMGYVQYSRIEKVIQKKGQVAIYFKSGLKLELGCDKRRLQRQMKRCEYYLDLVLDYQGLLLEEA